MNNIAWKYVKPLKNINILENFENENSVIIPNDLKECIKKYNGGRPNVRCFDTEESTNHLLKTLLSFNVEDIENIYKILDVFKIANKLIMIPFASDSFGNYICVKNSNIVYWNHENDKTQFVSNSFTEFMTILREG